MELVDLFLFFIFFFSSNISTIREHTLFDLTFKNFIILLDALFFLCWMFIMINAEYCYRMGEYRELWVLYDFLFMFLWQVVQDTEVLFNTVWTWSLPVVIETCQNCNLLVRSF